MSAPAIWTTRCAGSTSPARERPGAVDRPRRQRRRGRCPSSCAAASTIDVVTDQTSAHDPLNGYIPAGLTLEQADALRQTDPDEYLRRVGESAVAHVAAIRDAGRRRRRGVRLRQRAARAGVRARGQGRVLATRGSCRRTCGRCSARARARSAGSRCRAIPPTSTPPTRDPRPVRRPGAHRAVDQARLRARAVPGPAGADLLARLRRAPPGRAALQRDGRLGRGQGADRDRARPPRRRLGRLAPARDRGDGRRLGRDRRLAALERAGQHRLRGELGLDPPRRRRRHGQVDPRRPGVRRRRHRTGRRSGSSGPEGRPGMGIVRHVDAGYDLAVSAARDHGLRIPMLESE